MSAGFVLAVIVRCHDSSDPLRVHTHNITILARWHSSKTETICDIVFADVLQGLGVSGMWC